MSPDAYVAVIAGLVAVVTAGVPWTWRGPEVVGGTSGDQRAGAEQVLSDAVREQWSREAVLRQLFDPWPMAVVWTPVGGGEAELADHAELTGMRPGLRFSGAQELADFWAESARRRTVLVGDAGSGKTSCAVLFTLALLDMRHSPEVPVPVVLTASSFRPERESAERWLRRQLLAEYPVLGDRERFGPDAAGDLLARHRVAPVIDGLDELEPGRRTRVLCSLVEGLDPRAPLMLTCRSREYAEAVAECGVLPRAAVLVPSPVAPAEAVRSLALCDQPGPRQAAWRGVAQEVAATPDGPLASVLATPLGVNLVRAHCVEGTVDPRELLDRHRFADVRTLQRHLLGALVPALYARASARDPQGVYGGSPERAERWLRFLASVMARQRTRDFAWWRLHDTSRATRSAWGVAAFIGACAVGVTLPWLVDSVKSSPTVRLHGDPWVPLLVARLLSLLLMVPSLLLLARRRSGRVGDAVVVVTLASIVPAALAAAYSLAYVRNSPSGPLLSALLTMTVLVTQFLPVLMVAGLPSSPRQPRRGHFSTQAWRARLSSCARRFAAVTAVVGAASLTVESMMFCLQSRGRLQFQPVCAAGNVDSALVVGTIVGAMAAVAYWYESTGVPAGRGPSTPRSSLRHDRRLAFAFVAAGAVLTLVDTAVTWVMPSANSSAVPLGEFAMLLLEDLVGNVGPLGAAVAVMSTCWPYYALTRLRYALAGHLPWRLQACLVEAHRLGVLRQVGAVYQFRHALLQDELARPQVPTPRARDGRGSSLASATGTGGQPDGEQASSQGRNPS
ncbi:NACHT domain-containing protein [Streptomyces sp. NBC_00124]|uniref:NACHT domain-containing protein n=1 Tax=Streptomyces sp. NBC_00124 TaxID=2975662 RepID=UPI002250DF18|nr:NACHT domain-containing protein [Streptomyces sp. NBC_00124]MCX5367078.1 NACHT domain-containing protein [Streptomyces sp. NBC_00124]